MGHDRMGDHSLMTTRSYLVNQSNRWGSSKECATVKPHSYQLANQLPTNSNGRLTCAGNIRHLFELPRVPYRNIYFNPFCSYVFPPSQTFVEIYTPVLRNRNTTHGYISGETNFSVSKNNPTLK